MVSMDPFGGSAPACLDPLNAPSKAKLTRLDVELSIALDAFTVRKLPPLLNFRIKVVIFSDRTSKPHGKSNQHSELKSRG